MTGDSLAPAADRESSLTGHTIIRTTWSRIRKSFFLLGLFRVPHIQEAYGTPLPVLASVGQSDGQSLHWLSPISWPQMRILLP